MTTYSSRDLRENPAPMLRDLEAGQSPVITLRGTPVGIVVPFDLVVEGGARLGLAIRLYAAGAVSLGTAARIAERSVEEFMEQVGRAGVVDVFSDVTRLEEDVAALEDA